MIAVAAMPPRTNTGIVPPWLERDARVMDATLDRQHGGVINDSLAGAAHSHELPAGSPSRSVGAFGQARSLRNPAKEAAELQVAQREVTNIRAFFSKLGVQDHEGNGPASIEIDDDYPNAHYDSQTDGLKIGMLPLSQIKRGAEDVSFTAAPDVLAHEWAHRVVRTIVPTLGRLGEDSAISESLADTFAVAYDTKNWTLGEGLGVTIRTLDDPHADRLEQPGGHPASVADAQRMFQDPAYRTEFGTPEGHALSAIPSKAAAEIGKALGRDTMARIYIDAVRNFRPGSNITGLAIDTMESALKLYGDRSKEAMAVGQAWKSVGIIDLLQANPNSTPPVVV